MIFDAHSTKKKGKSILGAFRSLSLSLSLAFYNQVNIQDFILGERFKERRSMWVVREHSHRTCSELKGDEVDIHTHEYLLT